VGRADDLLKTFARTGDDPIHFPESNFYLLHPPGGIIAAYQRCTHLGCMQVVYNRAKIDQLDCTCHSAYIDKRTAVVVGGHAPRPLDLLHMREEDGVLVVDLNTVDVIRREKNVWNPVDLEIHVG
jgi:Rieske Fe-S protein